MLLTHFGITEPLFIYLFILLSAENLCHVNRPQGPVVKHREEKCGFSYLSLEYSRLI